MRRAVFTFFVAAFFAIGPLRAQTPAPAPTPSADSLAAAHELVEVTKGADRFKALLPTIFAKLKPAIVQNRPDVEKRYDAAAPIVLEAATARVNEIVDLIAKIYAQHFSAAELRELIAFYKTPTGQKFVTEQTAIARESLEAGSQFGRTLEGEIRSRIIAEMGKLGSTTAAQAIFFEANSGPGTRDDGSVTWRIENVSPGPGLAAEPTIKAAITIPDRQMTVTWSLRRNKDRTLPASHVIEITFNLPAGFPGGSVNQVPGVLMKPTQMAKGTPLTGISVKVTTNFQMIGLSAADADVIRNVKLLRDMDWIDIPIVFADGHRAILAVQKGQSGGRVFNDAFAAWNGNAPAGKPAPMIKTSIEMPAAASAADRIQQP